MRRISEVLDRIRRAASDDSGIALMVVISVSVIIFILLTAVLTLATYHETQSARFTARTKAMHMADAGINAYLYELKRDWRYYVSTTHVGPVEEQDGYWVLDATAPTKTAPLTLRSVGTITAQEASRTIIAEVRFPTFADYVILYDGINGTKTYTIGAGATFNGKVRTNGSISNAGVITGKVTAGGTCSGTGVYQAGYLQNQPKVDFAAVTADLAEMSTAAQTVNSYRGPSGGLGYELVFKGTFADIYKVTAIAANSGARTTTLLGTLPIPECGVIYINDTVWVSGTYSKPLCIGSSADIIVPKNFAPADATGSVTGGLVASNDILFPSWYTETPADLICTAALLAQNGCIGCEYSSSSGYGNGGDRNLSATPPNPGHWVLKNSITLTGSRAMKDQLGFNSGSGTTENGFHLRYFNYDPRLDGNPPPMYPQIKDGSLKVSTWIED